MSRNYCRTSQDRRTHTAGPLWRYPKIHGHAAPCSTNERYVAIDAAFVAYGGNISFDVFLRKNGQYFLFAKGGTAGGKTRERLIENGVDALYIQTEDRKEYDTHAEAVFGGILQNMTLPVTERSRLLHSYSLDLGRELLGQENALQLDEAHKEKVERLSDASFEYLSGNNEALSTLGRLLQHNNKTYNHCVNVSLYTLCVLTQLGFDRAMCRLAGAGAILHDIGKVKVPREILDKPGRLTDEERTVINNHPDDGLSLCRNMNLAPFSRDCVIFHHEKLDGSGYPAGARTIPDHVRVITIADIYDALTSDRPYSKRLTPFEAMKIIMKDVDAGKLDRGIYAEFVKILTSNQLLA